MILNKVKQPFIKELITGHKVKRKLVLVDDGMLEFIYHDPHGVWYRNVWRAGGTGTSRVCHVIQYIDYVDAVRRYYDAVVEARENEEHTKLLALEASKSAVNELIPVDLRKWYAERAYAIQFMLKDDRI